MWRRRNLSMHECMSRRGFDGGPRCMNGRGGPTASSRCRESPTLPPFLLLSLPPGLARGVLEIRNSRGYRNACGLCLSRQTSCLCDRYSYSPFLRATHSLSGHSLSHSLPLNHAPSLTPSLPASPSLLPPSLPPSPSPPSPSLYLSRSLSI